MGIANLPDMIGRWPVTDDFLSEKQMHYHLIGIGGSGMSAIAQILHERGDVVTGSDRQENDAVRRLRAMGIKISLGHCANSVDGADAVVYSAAIPQDNPEMQEARRRGISLIERPAMLGRLMEPFPKRVAVSGTHGKTTTTAMICAILDQAEMDATVLIGGDLGSLGGNARLGRSSVVVTEACEAFGSFLHLHPSMAVITNIDADHLDYYKSIEQIENAFRQFVSQVDSGGSVIAYRGDTRIRHVLEDCGRRMSWFGTTADCDIFAEDIDIFGPNAAYTLVRDGERFGRVTLGVPGMQNVMDSLAAAEVAFQLGVESPDIRAALREFRGAGRRWEVLYDDGQVLVVDDYAHHPAEIAATLSAARAAYAGRRLIAAFQPHTYTRTQAFVKEFAQALEIADEVIVTSIYAAREQPIAGVSAEAIVECMRMNGCVSAAYMPDKSTIAAEIRARVKAGDLVLIMGAGDIRMVGEELASMLSEREKADESR